MPPSRRRGRLVVPLKSLHHHRIRLLISTLLKIHFWCSGVDISWSMNMRKRRLKLELSGWCSFAVLHYEFAWLSNTSLLIREWRWRWLNQPMYLCSHLRSALLADAAPRLGSLSFSFSFLSFSFLFFWLCHRYGKFLFIELALLVVCIVLGYCIDFFLSYFILQMVI